MTSRTEQLRDLMAAHKLSVAQVGAILHRTPTTVRIWRCKDDRRQIPEHALQLLRTKVAAK